MVNEPAEGPGHDWQAIDDRVAKFSSRQMVLSIEPREAQDLVRRFKFGALGNAQTALDMKIIRRSNGNENNS